METIDVAGLIEKNKEEISKRLIESFANDVAKSIGWTMQNEIQKHAEEYIKAHVLPEVQAQLEADKAQLVTTIVASVKAGVDGLGLKIAEKVQKSLSDSWKVSEIAKKLIDSY